MGEDEMRVGWPDKLENILRLIHYASILPVIDLKFNFNWVACISLPNLVIPWEQILWDLVAIVRLGLLLFLRPLGNF